MRYCIVLAVILVAVVALCGCQSITYEPSAPALARLEGMAAVRAADLASHEVTPARLSLARAVLVDAEAVLRAEAPDRAAVVAKLINERLDYALRGVQEADRAILSEAVGVVLDGVRLEAPESVDGRQAALVAAEFVRGMILEIDAITAAGNASAGKRPGEAGPQGPAAGG